MSVVYKQGPLRGEKIQYPDGTGICIWYPFPDEPEDDSSGYLAFDIQEDAVDDLITLLQTLKTVKPDPFEE